MIFCFPKSELQLLGRLRCHMHHVSRAFSNLQLYALSIEDTMLHVSVLLAHQAAFGHDKGKSGLCL